MYFFLCIALALLCLILAFFLFRKRKQTPKLDVNATELLAQLMQRNAVVVLGVVDQNELFMWSPRDRQ